MTTDPIFYIIRRVLVGGPLIDEFLLGQYDRNEYGKSMQEQEASDTVCFSKNVSRIPKILNSTGLVLPNDLMLQLRGNVKVERWKRVEFTNLFNFEYGVEEGFEIFERYIDEQEKQCKKDGIAEFDIEFHVNSDPTLAYWDFADRYKISDFEFATDFWQLIPANSHRVAKLESKKDAVCLIFENEEPCFRSQKESSDDDILFSVSSLADYKVLGLSSISYAVAPAQFAMFEPYLESEFFKVTPIRASDLPDASE